MKTIPRNKCLRYSYMIIALLTFGMPSFAQQQPDNVIVLPKQMAAPANAKKIGTIKAGDNATSLNCDYEGTVTELKDKAKTMGGNVVKITDLIPPQFISKCYRVQADVYYTDSFASCSKAIIGNVPIKDTTSSTSGYAMLYIYRLKDTLAFEPVYNLHLNTDSVICRVKSKGHAAVKIFDTGTITLWAKTTQRGEVKLRLKKGATYYLRCGLKHGEISLVPFMELIDETSGAYEYSKLNKGKTDVGLEYLKQVH